MKRAVLLIFVFLFTLQAFAINDANRWHYRTNQTGTAATITAKTKSGATNACYYHFRVCNVIEPTDTVWIDVTGTHPCDSGGAETVTTAVAADNSKPSSWPIYPGYCHTFDLTAPRREISAVCDAGQTCSGVDVYGW